MFDAIDFEWDKEKKGLIVSRTPIYYNERKIDEKIDVILNYRLSDFKNRKSMYERILIDTENLKDSLIKALKSIK